MDEDLESMADSFADLRPDGHAVNDEKQIISLREFSRTMDTEDNSEARTAVFRDIETTFFDPASVFLSTH